MVITGLGFNSNGHWGVVYTQGVGHKGGGLKAPEFFVQLLGSGIVWYQAQHLLLSLQ
jgi:hypothetical protein